MKDNLKLAPKLINDFSRALEKRSTYFLVPEALSEILDLHIKTWRKDMNLLQGASDEKSRERWAAYYQLHTLLNNMISVSETRILSERSIDAWSFFDRVGKHLKKYRDEKAVINGNDRYYASDMLSVFYDTFFQKINGSPSEYDIWNHYFPYEWKVTKSEIEKPEGILARITLGEFFEFAQKRIWDSKEKEFDAVLNEASENLFPELDPVRWAEILIFTFAPYDVYDVTGRVKFVISRPWTFGLGGRMREFGSHNMESKEDFEKQVEANMRMMDEQEKAKTCEFVGLLRKRYGIFYHLYTIENLNKLINEAKSLEFPAQSVEELRRRSLLNLFSELATYLAQQAEQEKKQGAN